MVKIYCRDGTEMRGRGSYVGTDLQSRSPRTDGRLPLDLAAFVGRDEALTMACGLLRHVRMLTLTGPGGVGKTRLALRVATHVTAGISDGAWVVDVGELNGPDDRSAERLYAQVALQLGIRHPGPMSVDVLVARLQSRRALLVLDSCEYLLPETRHLVTRLLQAAPDLRVLATSRQPLGVDGERTLVVPPLSLPDSARLFVELATAAGADREILADAAVVRRLCQQLDGLPMAIKLAAGRARTLSILELIERLSDRFGLLTDTAQAVGDRHSGLARAVDLSYQMCTEDERLVWARSSAFVGSFDLTAAEAIAGGHGVDTARVVDAVTGLVDKSVFTVDTRSGPARYAMLDTLREYGRQRLVDPDEILRLQDCHRGHYRAFLEQASRTWLGPDELETLARVRLELPNVLSAIDHSIAAGDLSCARALIQDLIRTRACFFWGFFDLTVQQLHRVMTAAGVCPVDPAHAADVAATYCAAAFIAAVQGRKDQSEELIATATATLNAHQLPTIAPLLFARGSADMLLSGTREAIGLLSAAREMFAGDEFAGDRHMATMMWAIAYALAGEPAAATAACSQYLGEAERAQAPWATSWALWASALAALRASNSEQATELIIRCLKLQQSMDDQWGQTWSIELCAWIIAARLGDAASPATEAKRAAWLLGAAHARQQKLGVLLAAMRPLADGRAQACALLSDVLPEQSINAEISAGEQAHAHAIRIALGENTSRRPSATSSNMLTDREREVAELIARGHSTKQIAGQLCITVRTVETHVSNILGKLKMHHRGELAAWVHGKQDGTPDRYAENVTGPVRRSAG